MAQNLSDQPPRPGVGKWRGFARVMLRLAALLAAFGLGAWVVSWLNGYPASDLSQVDFPYAVGESGGMPVVRVFFATNRQVISAKEGTFADTEGDHLVYGMALVRIPPGLRIGDLQLPEIPRGSSDQHHPTVLEVDILPEEQFYKALNERLDKVEARMVNIMVHGVNHTFDSSLRQAGALRFDLDMAQPIVLFAWPTGPGVLPGNYHVDEDRVSHASMALTEFLEGFQQNVHPRKINLISHSLGCKVVCQSFHELLTRAEWNDKETEMENVIFAAPDVDRDDFNEHFVRDVSLLAARVTVYVADNDGVLVLSSIVNGLPRAGVRDPGEDIAPEVQSLIHTDPGNIPAHIEVVDATFVNNAHTAHSYYYQSRPVFSDFYTLLRDDVPADERHLLHYKGAGQANYWIIPP